MSSFAGDAHQNWVEALAPLDSPIVTPLQVTYTNKFSFKEGGRVVLEDNILQFLMLR